MVRTTCKVCGQPDARTFFSLDHVPVHCNVQWNSSEAAQCVPFGDILLAFCPRCGHIFNAAFDPARVEYTDRYENSLHFSPRFEDYAVKLAGELVERHSLKYKRVIEIGAGKGEFLSLLNVMGHNDGVGFDPGYASDLPPDSKRRLQFIAGTYSVQYSDLRPDLILCRHVLEHLSDPVSLLAEVRASAVADDYPPVYFEVPNVLYTLRDLGIWDIIYEHVSYFSPASLAAAFEKSGFEVVEVSEAYGGQFLQLHARPGKPAKQWQPGPEAIAELQHRVVEFGRQFQQKVRTWRQRLRANRKRTVLWGAGSKGVTFLNVFADLRPADYVVDVNPRKRDLYVAGTGQKIVFPEFLEEHRPELILIANPLYEGEIRERVAALGLTPEFAVL